MTWRGHIESAVLRRAFLLATTMLMAVTLLAATGAEAAEQPSGTENTVESQTSEPDAVDTTAAVEPSAETGSTTVEGDETTVEEGDGSGSSSAPSNGNSSSSKDEPGWALLVLVLGALGLGLAYAFYDGWRSSYQQLSLAALKATHVFPDTIFNPVEDAQARSSGLSEQDAEALPVVEGPPVVTVGEPTTYTAADKDGNPLETCEWEIVPEGAASLSSGKGAEVTVTAAKEGSFTLSATAPEKGTNPIRLTAIAKVGKSGGVPLLGSNFGGVAVVILAVSIAGVLAALEILGADAFIAFIGPVVGYFFAARVSSGSTGGGSSGDSTSG